VTGYKATKAKEEQDTQLVEENPEQVGENYIKAQQNLPDVVVVGGEGSGSEESSTPGADREVSEAQAPPRRRGAGPAREGAGHRARRLPLLAAETGGERRADRPARPAAGEVHGDAGRPRRRLLRDGDPRPRADGRADPQGRRAAAGRLRAARARAGARAAAR